MQLVPKELVSKGMDLKVTNSVFKNNKASNQGPDICFNNNKGNVYIDNSFFLQCY